MQTIVLCNSICHEKHRQGAINVRVIIIIPAYNEQSSILSVCRQIERNGYDYLVINDGSHDRTLDICREHHLNVLNLPRNLGIGGAVQAGHMYALEHGYDVDIQFDGDGQHDAAYLQALVDAIEQGADIAIGSRYLEDTDGFKSTFMRRVGITWLSAWIRLFRGKTITDPTSGFRACGKRAIKLFCSNYPYDYPEPESIVTALGHGLMVREVPVVMHERQGGQSSISPLKGAYYMIKVTLAIAISALSNRPKRAR